MEQKREIIQNSQVVSDDEVFSIPQGALSLSQDENYTAVAHGEYSALLKKPLHYKNSTAAHTSYDEQKKKLDEAEQMVAKQGSHKKKVWNLIFFLISLGILAFILIKEFVGEGFTPLVIKNWSAIFIVLAFFGLSYICEVFTFSYLMKKSVGKSHFLLAFKTNALGKYYDSVTPLATGGQPFQITYLKSHDIPLHAALAIPLAKYTFSQISWVLLSFICMIISFSVSGYNSLMSWVSVVGWVLGSAVLIATIFLSVSKNTGRKILVKVLKLLQKMKIVKNFEKTYTKISKQIEDFQSVMQQYAKSPKDIIILTGLAMCHLLIHFATLFFIYALLIDYNWALFSDFFINVVMMDLAASFFPLPGGSGMSEFSFEAFMSVKFGGSFVWAMLIWRFVTYYIHLLIGISVITYDFSYGNRRFRWQRRKSELAQESAIFKQEQIDKFRAERNRRRRSATQRF